MIENIILSVNYLFMYFWEFFLLILSRNTSIYLFIYLFVYLCFDFVWLFFFCVSFVLKVYRSGKCKQCGVYILICLHGHFGFNLSTVGQIRNQIAIAMIPCMHIFTPHLLFHSHFRQLYPLKKHKLCHLLWNILILNYIHSYSPQWFHCIVIDIVSVSSYYVNSFTFCRICVVQQLEISLAAGCAE